jgi:hypothetical protein
MIVRGMSRIGNDSPDNHSPDEPGGQGIFGKGINFWFS